MRAMAIERMEGSGLLTAGSGPASAAANRSTRGGDDGGDGNGDGDGDDHDGGRKRSSVQTLHELIVEVVKDGKDLVPDAIKDSIIRDIKEGLAQQRGT